jgi:hypothetical protein
MDRFHDLVSHTHELVVRGWRTRASRHMVTDNLRGVVQTIREHYRSALGQDVWGERPSTSKLRHDVDEG